LPFSPTCAKQADKFPKVEILCKRQTAKKILVDFTETIIFFEVFHSVKSFWKQSNLKINYRFFEVQDQKKHTAEYDCLETINMAGFSTQCCKQGREK